MIINAAAQLRFRQCTSFPAEALVDTTAKRHLPEISDEKRGCLGIPWDSSDTGVRWADALTEMMKRNNFNDLINRHSQSVTFRMIAINVKRAILKRKVFGSNIYLRMTGIGFLHALIAPCR